MKTYYFINPVLFYLGEETNKYHAVYSLENFKNIFPEWDQHKITKTKLLYWSDLVVCGTNVTKDRYGNNGFMSEKELQKKIDTYDGSVVWTEAERTPIAHLYRRGDNKNQYIVETMFSLNSDCTRGYSFSGVVWLRTPTKEERACILPCLESNGFELIAEPLKL